MNNFFIGVSLALIWGVFCGTLLPTDYSINFIVAALGGVILSQINYRAIFKMDE